MISKLALTIKKIVGYEGELYFNDTKPDGTMVKLNELEDGIVIR